MTDNAKNKRKLSPNNSDNDGSHSPNKKQQVESKVTPDTSPTKLTATPTLTVNRRLSGVSLQSKLSPESPTKSNNKGIKSLVQPLISPSANKKLDTSITVGEIQEKKIDLGSDVKSSPILAEKSVAKKPPLDTTASAKPASVFTLEAASSFGQTAKNSSYLAARKTGLSQDSKDSTTSNFSSFASIEPLSSSFSMFAPQKKEGAPSKFADMLKEARDVKDDEEEESKPAGFGIKPVVTLLPIQNITGEEDEKNVMSARCKLYILDPVDKVWKERGVGALKLNIKKKDKKIARLVMRSDGVLKILLNVNVTANLSCQITQDKYLKFFAFEDKGEQAFMAKFGKASECAEMMSRIQDIDSK